MSEPINGQFNNTDPQLQEFFVSYIAPILQQQNLKISALEELVSFQKRTIEELQLKIETIVQPNETIVKNKKAQLPTTIPILKLPKPSDLNISQFDDSNHTNGNQTSKNKMSSEKEKPNEAAKPSNQRRQTYVKPSEKVEKIEKDEKLPLRRSTVILNQSQLPNLKEIQSKKTDTPTEKLKPIDKNASKNKPKTLNSSQSTKDFIPLKQSKVVEEKNVKVIDKNAIKQKKQPADVLPTTQKEQVVQQFEQVDLLQKLQLQEPVFEGDVDLLAEEPVQKTNILEENQQNQNTQIQMNEQDVLQQVKVTLDESEQKHLESLINLCQGDFQASLVLNEIYKESENIELKIINKLCDSLEEIKTNHESQLYNDIDEVENQVIMQFYNFFFSFQAANQQLGWMTKWSRESIQLIESGFINEIIQIKVPDTKILNIFEFFFFVVQENKYQEDQAKFWDQIKQYLTQNHNQFGKILLDIEQKEYSIYQLMDMEALLKKYPYIAQKNTFEDMDALASVLAFIFEDMAEHFGLINNDSISRKQYLFRRGQVFKGRLNEINELISNLKKIQIN